MKRRAVPALLAGFVLASGQGSALGAAGDMDPAFSDDGFLPVGGTVGTAITGLAEDPSSGDLVASLAKQHVDYCIGRWGCTYRVEPTIARLDAGGSLEPGFAGDGEFEGSSWPTEGDWADPELNDFAVAMDGSVVLAGEARGASRGWVARLTPEGRVDTSFGGGDGAATFDFMGGSSASSDEFDHVAIAADGRIVLAGTSDPAPLSDTQYVVAALKPDGSLDPAFSENGWLAISTPGDAAFVRGLELAPAGRIILFGAPFYPATEVLAFTSGGDPDPGFGNGGRLQVDLVGSAPDSTAIDPRGRLLLLGIQPDGRDPPAALARLTVGGQLDTSFGEGGFGAVRPPLPAGEFEFSLGHLEVDSQSRPIVSGAAGATAVGRLNELGQMDDAFSDGGWSLAYQRDRRVGTGPVVLRDDAIVTAGAGDGQPLLSRRKLGDGGPVDSDADGVTNSAEECPYVFGTCPEVKRRIPPLEFKRHAGVRSWHSRLVSADNNCKWHQVVRLYRVKRGRDRQVARVRSRYGGIRFPARFRRGRYYAASARRTLGYGACPAVQSRPVRRPGR